MTSTTIIAHTVDNFFSRFCKSYHCKVWLASYIQIYYNLHFVNYTKELTREMAGTQVYNRYKCNLFVKCWNKHNFCINFLYCTKRNSVVLQNGWSISATENVLIEQLQSTYWKVLKRLMSKEVTHYGTHENLSKPAQIVTF